MKSGYTSLVCVWTGMTKDKWFYMVHITKEEYESKRAFVNSKEFRDSVAAAAEKMPRLDHSSVLIDVEE